MNPSITIILDTRRTKAGNKYPVKLRITFLRQQKYYPIGLDITQEEFILLQTPLGADKQLNLKGKRHINELKLKRDSVSSKAARIIDKMDEFSFRAFEKQFYQNANTAMDVYALYDNIIKKLKYYGSVGTASNYECSRNSLKKMFPKLSFRDIDSELLNAYENKLLSEGKSISTVGIYLRPLRAIFNEAIADGIISRDHYPFGKRQYQIPSSKNFKKALTLEEIGKIYKYSSFENTWEEKARDFFILSYLCNGMNMKDIALLKFKDIDDGFIRFSRAKTKGTIRTSSILISIFVSSAIESIIAKWKNTNGNPENYIFPIFQSGWSPLEERKAIQQFIKMVNKHLNKVASSVGVNKHITTYYARHSFATVLKRSGSSIEEISESLGHSSHKTTLNYLDSFEDESKKNIHLKLLNFK